MCCHSIICKIKYIFSPLLPISMFFSLFLLVPKFIWFSFSGDYKGSKRTDLTTKCGPAEMDHTFLWDKVMQDQLFSWLLTFGCLHVGKTAILFPNFLLKFQSYPLNFIWNNNLSPNFLKTNDVIQLFNSVRFFNGIAYIVLNEIFLKNVT